MTATRAFPSEGWGTLMFSCIIQQMQVTRKSPTDIAPAQGAVGDYLPYTPVWEVEGDDSSWAEVWCHHSGNRTVENWR